MRAVLPDPTGLYFGFFSEVSFFFFFSSQSGKMSVMKAIGLGALWERLVVGDGLGMGWGSEGGNRLSCGCM